MLEKGVDENYILNYIKETEERLHPIKGNLVT